MSQITYNGVTLTHLSTRSIDFEPAQSDDGMDTLFTKATFNVAGIVSPPISPATGGENATQTLARIEHYLNQKQGAFQYSVDGQPLVTWLGGPDARNGPHPKGVRVTQVAGSQLYHVDFQIELNINTCQADPRIPYVSHRWTEEVTIDETARTTKTRRGKIITRGDMLVSPDALRGLVMPPIDQGFLREESRYTLQSDGLALEYAYRDREQYLMPPAPSWKAQGTYTESTTDGAKRHGEVRLHLRGSKFTDKGELAKTAILIATSKLDAAGILRGQDRTYIAIGGIQEEMYEPEITISVKALLQPYRGRVAGLPINLRRFTDFPLGSQPGQNPATSPDPGTRGSAGLTLVAAALRDPCLSQVVLKAGGSEPSGQSILAGQGAAPLAVVMMTAVLPDDGLAVLRTGQGEAGIWTDYRIHIRTIQNQHRLQIPVGGVNTPPVICQTAGATQKRVIRWRCEKVGDNPDLPDPDIGPNYVLARAWVDTREVTPFGNGVDMKYAIAGKYVYFVTDFTTATMYAGLPPWLEPSAADAARAAVTRFAKGIIDVGAAGYGAAFRAAGQIASLVTNLPPG